MRKQPKAHVGDIVRRVGSSRIGVITDIAWNEQLEIWMYQVQFDDGGIRGLPEIAIEK